MTTCILVTSLRRLLRSSSERLWIVYHLMWYFSIFSAPIYITSGHLKSWLQCTWWQLILRFPIASGSYQDKYRQNVKLWRFVLAVKFVVSQNGNDIDVTLKIFTDSLYSKSTLSKIFVTSPVHWDVLSPCTYTCSLNLTHCAGQVLFTSHILRWWLTSRISLICEASRSKLDSVPFTCSS